MMSERATRPTIRLSLLTAVALGACVFASEASAQSQCDEMRLRCNETMSARCLNIFGAGTDELDVTAAASCEEQRAAFRTCVADFVEKCSVSGPGGTTGRGASEAGASPVPGADQAANNEKARTAVMLATSRTFSSIVQPKTATYRMEARSRVGERLSNPCRVVFKVRYAKGDISVYDRKVESMQGESCGTSDMQVWLKAFHGFALNAPEAPVWSLMESADGVSTYQASTDINGQGVDDLLTIKVVDQGDFLQEYTVETGELGKAGRQGKGRFKTRLTARYKLLNANDTDYTILERIELISTLAEPAAMKGAFAINLTLDLLETGVLDPDQVAAAGGAAERLGSGRSEPAPAESAPSAAAAPPAPSADEAQQEVKQALDLAVARAAAAAFLRHAASFEVDSNVMVGGQPARLCSYRMDVAYSGGFSVQNKKIERGTYQKCGEEEAESLKRFLFGFYLKPHVQPRWRQVSRDGAFATYASRFDTDGKPGDEDVQFKIRLADKFISEILVDLATPTLLNGVEVIAKQELTLRIKLFSHQGIEFALLDGIETKKAIPPSPTLPTGAKSNTTIKRTGSRVLQ